MSTEVAMRRARKGIPNRPLEFKRRLAEEACEPGISVSKLAQVSGVNVNMLFKWRRQYRAGHFDKRASVTLLPVSEPLTLECTDAERLVSGQIDIEHGAVRIRVRGNVSTAALRTILDRVLPAR